MQGTSWSGRSPAARQPGGVPDQQTRVAFIAVPPSSWTHDHLCAKGRERPGAMTAVARREAAPALLGFRPSARIVEHWHRSVPIRREWLDVGLATAPADRTAAESGLCRIYARHARPRPTFRWVDSP